MLYKTCMHIYYKRMLIAQIMSSSEGVVFLEKTKSSAASPLH